MDIQTCSRDNLGERVERVLGPTGGTVWQVSRLETCMPIGGSAQQGARLRVVRHLLVLLPSRFGQDKSLGAREEQ